MPHRICQKWRIGRRSLRDQISSTHSGQCAYQRRNAKLSAQSPAIAQADKASPGPEIASRLVSLVIAAPVGGAGNNNPKTSMKFSSETMEREGAALGIFLTLSDPTREMEKEAASAGFYETGDRKFLKLQILTAAQVIDSKRSQSRSAHRKPQKQAAKARTSKHSFCELLTNRPTGTS